MLEAKQEHYIRNGAILLEKQLNIFQGKSFNSEPLKIFSFKDIRQATNNFDQGLIIGSGIGPVYEGIMDNVRVAIKVPQGLACTQRNLDFFLNQVTIKQVINHKNVVKLYGCCLETEIPILVSEFRSNGSLYDNLHKRNPNSWSLSWLDRVGIAREISYALSYMHLGPLKPIVHLDVKKLLTAIDPTVILSSHDSLANYFVSHVQEDRLIQIIDSRVLKEGSKEEIEAFAALAFKCVRKGDERPTMKEATLELRRIHQLVRSR
ncbi:hypothetical protein PTKIN_Ptkin01aG0291900 [Pterospermum kingtungense]